MKSEIDIIKGKLIFYSLLPKTKENDEILIRLNVRFKILQKLEVLND